MKKIVFLLITCVLNLAHADDGVYALNDVCDGFGCFSGDTGGLPITIANSGSYILTSNLVSSSETVNVIEITADNVTLDLNGFSIIGPRTCTGSNDTLSCTNAGMTASAILAAGRSNVVIKNGITQGFDTGVRLTSTSQRGNVVHHANSSQNEFGFVMINGMISDSTANLNLDTGFSNGLFGTLFVRDSFAFGNGLRSAFAFTCSNVMFSNNGSDADCQRYTNESTCGNGLTACP
ncbi:MAG: hypothetical protein AB8B80_10285 [Marinicellaceae bacterium]